MKIKTLIILTLIISFNYSVYSEDKKDAIKEYKAFDELKTLRKSCGDSEEENEEILDSLSKLDIRNDIQDAVNYRNMARILENIHDVTIAAHNLMICLRYEKVIYENNIHNKSLISIHNISRGYFCHILKINLENGLKNVKEYRIKIQNTTAVIAVNKSIVIMIKLQKWLKINSKSVLKPLP